MQLDCVRGDARLAMLEIEERDPDDARFASRAATCSVPPASAGADTASPRPHTPPRATLDDVGGLVSNLRSLGIPKDHAAALATLQKAAPRG
jgi:hypothetical protein